MFSFSTYYSVHLPSDSHRLPLACPNMWTRSTKLYLLPLLSPHCRMELVMQRTGWSSRAPKIDDEESPMLTLSVLCHTSANFVCRMAASVLALSSRHRCRTPRIAVRGLLVAVASLGWRSGSTAPSHAAPCSGGRRARPT